MTNNDQKYRLLKIEKILLFCIIIVLVLIPISNVYLKAIVSETNIGLEKVKFNIERQEKINEGLSMMISELTSYDKIQEIADKYGLSYNNDNIKIIESE